MTEIEGVRSTVSLRTKFFALQKPFCTQPSACLRMDTHHSSHQKQAACALRSEGVERPSKLQDLQCFTGEQRGTFADLGRWGSRYRLAVKGCRHLAITCPLSYYRGQIKQPEATEEPWSNCIAMKSHPCLAVQTLSSQGSNLHRDACLQLTRSSIRRTWVALCMFMFAMRSPNASCGICSRSLAEHCRCIEVRWSGVQHRMLLCY